MPTKKKSPKKIWSKSSMAKYKKPKKKRKQPTLKDMEPTHPIYKGKKPKLKHPIYKGKKPKYSYAK